MRPMPFPQYPFPDGVWLVRPKAGSTTRTLVMQARKTQPFERTHLVIRQLLRYTAANADSQACSPRLIPPGIGTKNLSKSSAAKDRHVQDKLAHLVAFRRDAWSQRGKGAGQGAYFQYPAMMVESMQGDLMDAVMDETTQSVWDPFAGSGVTLWEAMARGRSFTGGDINPLAILICRVKAGPYDERALRTKAVELLVRLDRLRLTKASVTFQGIDKWFHPAVTLELSAIRESIMDCQLTWCRRFFWICLAETVRRCSNSRTTTYKLHTRPKEELDQDRLAKMTFISVLRQNLDAYSIRRVQLARAGLLRGTRYLESIKVGLKDARLSPREKHDLLVTSPPYGDHQSTVPYGQQAYLPLQWVQLADIDAGLDRTCLRSTLEIDNRGLGGTLTNALERSAASRRASQTLDRLLVDLRDQPRDRVQRVAAYCADLHRSVDAIARGVRDGGYMLWTVGNRRVGGRPVSLHDILREFLEAQGARHVATVERPIPRKRMASRNAIAATISAEKVLIMRAA